MVGRAEPGRAERVVRLPDASFRRAGTWTRDPFYAQREDGRVSRGRVSSCNMRGSEKAFDANIDLRSVTSSVLHADQPLLG